MENIENKKEFTIKDLTKRGWIRREDLDFKDDGTKFKVLEYTNGLQATYTKSDGYYYLALRIDYIGDLLYEEYSQMNSYKLADEFNYSLEVDADKVCENAKLIMEEYNELKKIVDKKEINFKKIIDQAQKEKSMVDRILYDSNISIDDLNHLDMIELRQLKQYRETIKNSSTNRLKNLAEEKYTNRELRQMEYRLKNSGYLTVDANGYYITRIKEIIKKARGKNNG